MGWQSNYNVNLAIDHQFRSAAWGKPAHNWLALFTALPGDTGGGVEVAGGSYARVDLPPSDTNWYSTQGTLVGGISNGLSRQTSNGLTVTFPAPTADWGAILGMAAFDANVAGNELAWSVFTLPLIVHNGDPAPTFPPGSIVFLYGAN